MNNKKMRKWRIMSWNVPSSCSCLLTENNVFASGQGKKVNKVLRTFDVIALFYVTWLSHTCEVSMTKSIKKIERMVWIMQVATSVQLP